MINKYSSFLFHFIIVLVGLLNFNSLNGALVQDSDGNWYANDRIIYGLKQNSSQNRSAVASATNGAIISQLAHANVGAIVAKIDNKVSDVDSVIADLISSETVDYAERDYVKFLELTPSDSYYSANNLWGLNNPSNQETDIDAPEAWDISTGSSNVVVAVIDTGVDYTHADLINQMWINPFEIAGNGIDDDGNGYVDDIYGVDEGADDSDPIDEHGHGTHLAGTIGAQANNGGVVGVNWNVSIMALKSFQYFEGYGWGAYDSDSASCFDYALAMKNAGVNVRVTNNSYGGSGYSTTLRGAIERCGNAGILSVAAAGNDAENTDTNPHYPSAYDLDCILSVASSDQYDSLSYFSSYGKTTVDLSAPGSSIYSAKLGGGWTSKSGTSMASPHVAGVAALVSAVYPDLSYLEVKDRILQGTRPKSYLTDITVSGGLLNAYYAIVASEPAMVSPAPGSTLNSTEVTFDWNDNGTSVSQWQLMIGSTVGGNDIWDMGILSSPDVVVNDLPSDGSTLYVRLRWNGPSGWEYADYTYEAFTALNLSIASNRRISSGGTHSLFIQSDGSLWGMGNNAYAQLGDGTTTERRTPVQIDSGVLVVSGGATHTHYIKSDGSLWGMGKNGSGELGDGTTTSRLTPVQIDANVVAVSGGGYHTHYLKSDGRLFGMGSNNWGELGDGSNTDRLTPVLISSNVVAVSGGGTHTHYLKSDGSLWGMGFNVYGQLGDGTDINRRTPVQIDTGVLAVSGGSIHTHYIKSDGRLFGMGSNYWGQLGDGSHTDRLTPVQIDANVVAVSAGDTHTHYIKSDGSLWGMGFNGFGQLGDGTNTGRLTPVQIDTNVVAVSGGNIHTLYAKSNEELWGMGSNTHGQLTGSGNKVTPIFIANLDVGSPSTDFEYGFASGGVVVITGYKGAGGDVIIPETIEGGAVVSIQDGAFGVDSGVTSVTIPHNLFSFSGGAFLSSVLTQINAKPGHPDFISIDGVLFNIDGLYLRAYPSGLTGHYNVPEGVTRIATSAFESRRISSISFPNSLEEIGSYAFYRCTGLTKLNLNKGLVKIENSAFYGTQFEAIRIPDTVTSIGASAFANCSNLRWVVFDGDAPTVGSSAFSSAVSFGLYYRANSGDRAVGFSTPTWNGYACEPISISFNPNGASYPGWSNSYQLDVTSNCYWWIDQSTVPTWIQFDQTEGESGITVMGESLIDNDTGGARTHYVQFNGVPHRIDQQFGEFTAPRNVSVHWLSSTKIKIEWQDIALEDGYRINFQHNGQWTFAGAVEANATSMEIDVSEDGRYGFIVRSFQGTEIKSADIVWLEPLQDVGLTAPSNVTAQWTSATTIQVNWDDADGEEDYRINYQHNGVWTFVGTLAANSTSIDITVPEDGRYGILVRSKKGAESKDAAMVWLDPQTPPELTAPSNVSVQWSAANKILVQWTDAENETEYRINYQHNGVWTYVGSLPADRTSIEITVPEDGRYGVLVRSKKGAESKDAAMVWLEPQTPPELTAPSNVGVQWSAANKILVQWTDAENETEYRINYQHNGVWTYVGSLPADRTSIEITVPENGRYGVLVRSKKGAESKDAAMVWLEPQTPPELTAPSNVSIQWSAANKILVQWTDAENETEYRINYQYNGVWTYVGALPANSTSVEITVPEDGRYGVLVRSTRGAESKDGVMAWLEPQTPPELTAPSNVSVQWSAANKILVQWTDAENETDYRINYQHNGVWTYVGALAADSTSIEITVPEDGRYGVLVRSKKGAESKDAAMVWLEPQTPPELTAPSNVSLQWSAANKILVQWTDAENETEYRINYQHNGAWTYVGALAADSTSIEITVPENGRYGVLVRSKRGVETKDASIAWLEPPL